MEITNENDDFELPKTNENSDKSRVFYKFLSKEKFQFFLSMRYKDLYSLNFLFFIKVLTVNIR